MREDQLEQLERMFPQGFLLIHRVDDDPRHLQFALSKQSTNRYLFILWTLLQQFIQEEREREQGH